MTNTTGATGRNDPWRYNNGANTGTHMNPQGHTTRPTSHSSFHNNSPNSSDNRNGPTCFKCGEQGHMRMDCRERFFCTHCSFLQITIQKHAGNTTVMPPVTTNSHIPAGYHPTATCTTTNGNSSDHTANTSNRCTQQRTIVPEPI